MGQRNSIWWFGISAMAAHSHQINRIIVNSLLYFVYHHSLKYKWKFLPKWYKFSYLQTFLVTNLERLLWIVGNVPRNLVSVWNSTRSIIVELSLCKINYWHFNPWKILYLLTDISGKICQMSRALNRHIIFHNPSLMLI